MEWNFVIAACPLLGLPGSICQYLYAGFCSPLPTSALAVRITCYAHKYIHTCIQHTVKDFHRTDYVAVSKNLDHSTDKSFSNNAQDKFIQERIANVHTNSCHGDT